MRDVVRGRQEGLSELIAESRRVQDALIRLIVRLDTFAERLTTEAATLSGAIGDEGDVRISDDERGPAPGTPGGGPSGAKGGRVDSGAGEGMGR